MRFSVVSTKTLRTTPLSSLRKQLDVTRGRKVICDSGIANIEWRPRASDAVGKSKQCFRCLSQNAVRACWAPPNGPRRKHFAS
jgi:hypothetical protein